MLTDDQRAHAIEELRSRGVPKSGANLALTALLDAGFIVLHPDDVTWACKYHGADVDHLMLDGGRACAHILSDGDYCRERLARTRWEPITDPADPQKETT